AEAAYLEADFNRQRELNQIAAQKAEQQAIAQRQQQLEDDARKHGYDIEKITTKAGYDSKDKAADRDLRRSLQEDEQLFKSMTAKEQREYEAANKKPDYSQGDSLRKEFQGLKPVKDFDQVNSAMEKVVASSQNATPATDIALITGFMKMNDPGSTVREGEFATAAEAGSANERLVGMYNGLINGQRLTQEQRDYFVDSSQRLYQAHANQYQSLKSQYGELATRQGLDPESIFIKRDIREAQQEQKSQGQTADLSSMSLEDLMAQRAKLAGQ
ncbi:MAG: hypothetical protein ACPGUE_21270, partial [Marinomonas sp.]